VNPIKQIFDEEFRQWEITLPPEDLLPGRRGSIEKNGWTINYRFGTDKDTTT
jgi:hypothetical protein